MAEDNKEPPQENRASSVKLVNGWDGKLRVNKSDMNGNSAEQSPPPSENDEPPEETLEGEQIDADEGKP